MANLETTTATAFTPADSGKAPDLLVSLAPLQQDAFDATLANLALAFPGQQLLVASPDANSEATQVSDVVHLLPCTAASPSSTSWVLSAGDYVNAYKLAKEHQVTTCLLLGAESQSLHPSGLRELAMAAKQADLAMACYDVSPREGLVNSAILYPVTRAIFGTKPRFPLAIDVALSLRMAERLATIAQKYTATNQQDALLWPVSEAVSANMSIVEVAVGTRVLPSPGATDLNTLLAQIAGSLFSEVEAKQSYWQRARGVQPTRSFSSFAPIEGLPDVQPMLDSFRLAYTNLHEIWSLVLPPNSLLGLKKLSNMSPSSFQMPDALWVRIVYDFILAWRLRTLNRGHLLGALTPLYLAWVASHILLIKNGTSPEAHVEAQAAAFEADKPYLVSRWRWPDRFNP